MIQYLFLSSLLLLQNTAPVRVVKFQANINNVKYVYGPAEPVARVRPGDIVETNTLDAFGNAIQKKSDKFSSVKGDNPLTGPFFIEGAQPGDTIAVKLLELTVDSKQGIGGVSAGWGALNKSVYTPMLHPDLPETMWIY